MNTSADIDDLITKISKLRINDKTILYISLSFGFNKKIIELLKTIDNIDIIEYKNGELINSKININTIIHKKIKGKDGFIIIQNGIIYDMNNEFHITLIYNKDNDEKIKVLEKLEGSIYNVVINKIAISDKYIIIGAELPDNLKPIYGGNEIVHITCACCIHDNPKEKYYSPVNSSSAFIEGIIIPIKDELQGAITIVYKK